MKKKIVEALNSPMRRAIVKVLAGVGDGLTVKEVREALKRAGNPVRYRETVYRALEILRDAELVEKYYANNKGICYRLKQLKIELDLTKLNGE
ncbi:MAG: transcriptional repressor [Nitrososphaerales archaeon]